MVVLLITCFKVYICVYLKRLESAIVSCFIMIPVLLYHVYNCNSAWFHLWPNYMCVLCTSLLYNLFVHMRFFVTCSSTWYAWAYGQLWFLIFSALVLFLQLSWWPSALWTLHTTLIGGGWWICWLRSCHKFALCCLFIFQRTDRNYHIL
jgi:hypothetical protein